jgi:hypothetical protein
MAYDKAKYTIIYEKDGNRYKLCKMFFGNDGSYYVTSPYHPAHGAMLYKHTVNYALSEMELSLEQAVDAAAAEDDKKRVKLSHHPDGFLQFSGQGIVSGKDAEGNIRGIGVMSWPLDHPVRGPAFGLTMYGLEHFEKAARVRDTPCVCSDMKNLRRCLAPTSLSWKGTTSQPCGDASSESDPTAPGLFR